MQLEELKKFCNKVRTLDDCVDRRELKKDWHKPPLPP